MTYHKQRIPLSEADHLGKETDEGSVEYKWKLVNISDDRLSHLVTQMKYRVAEGQGECIYEIGVDDSGLPKGLDESDYQESINTLKRMAEQLKCDLSIVCEKVVQTDPKMMCAEVMIRKFGEDDFVDVRVALCGHAGSGKSTLVGVLTRGTLDNGQGMARQKVFNHLHEIESGQTSSISQQILGFDSRGNVINYLSSNVGLDVTPQRIAEMSSKVCTLYDLAGHHKYIKTTVSGITGTTTDYACIVIRADTGIENTTKEHMGLCSSLKIPFFMVVTCIDLTDSSHLKNTLKSIRTLLKQPGVRKHFYHVRDEDDAIVSAKSIKPNRTVPVICVSNITGENLGLLRKFLNLLPVRREWEALAELPVQVAIDVVYLNVPEVKTVVAGLVEQGCVYIGDVLILGPDEDGKFRQVTIRGIQVKRVNVKKVEAGAHACFAVTSEEELEGIPGGLRKGMVLLDLKTEPTPEAYWRFEAYITILFASGTIQSNFQALLHCHGFRQKARIFLLNDPSGLRTGERALVQFEFMFQSEFIKEGMHLVFIEGSTKGIGSITRLIRVDQPPERSRFNSGNTRPRLGSRTKDSPLRKPTSPLTSAVPVDPSRIHEVSCSIPPKEETISNISIIEPNQQVPDQSIPQKQNDTSEGECSPLQSPLILQMPTEGKLKHTQSKREKRNSSTRKEKKQMNDEESSFNIYSD